MIIEGNIALANHYGYKTKKSIYDLRAKGMPIGKREFREKNFVILYDTDIIDAWLNRNNITPPSWQ